MKRTDQDSLQVALLLWMAVIGVILTYVLRSAGLL
jgi:hypothetical protein